jgi:hypothetical protein
MMRIGHYRPMHGARRSLSVETTLQARRQIVTTLLQIQGSIRGLLRMHGLKVGEIHRALMTLRCSRRRPAVAGFASHPRSGGGPQPPIVDTAPLLFHSPQGSWTVGGRLLALGSKGKKGRDL